MGSAATSPNGSGKGSRPGATAPTRLRPPPFAPFSTPLPGSILEHRYSRALAAVLCLSALCTAPLRAQLPYDPTLFAPSRDSMVLMASGRVVGSKVNQLVRTGEGFRAVEQLSVLQSTQQRTEILISREGRVRWVQQGGVLQGVAVRTSLEYRRDQVRGVTVVTSGSGPVSVLADTTLPAGTIDDNAITLFLPTLPYAVGARWSFPVFDGESYTITSNTLEVVGTATVALTSGPVETWEVVHRGDAGGGEVRYFIARSAPHRLVRIYFPAQEQEWRSVE